MCDELLLCYYFDKVILLMSWYVSKNLKSYHIHLYFTQEREEKDKCDSDILKRVSVFWYYDKISEPVSLWGIFVWGLNYEISVYSQLAPPFKPLRRHCITARNTWWSKAPYLTAGMKLSQRGGVGSPYPLKARTSVTWSLPSGLLSS